MAGYAKKRREMVLCDALEAKPFVKWAGGKGQLLKEILDSFPRSFWRDGELVYVEPFVGGGAVLFYLLKHFPNIKRAVASDKNPRLMATYRAIRHSPHELIESLSRLEAEYLPLGCSSRKAMYLAVRRRFNEEGLEDVERASLFIFLNKTCFNGLYRENSKGAYNVPHGRYARPLICDSATILADSKVLQKVELSCCDFTQTLQYASGHTLYYLDPPYKPLSATASFTSYVKDCFDDDDQVRLRSFCDALAGQGGKFLLSNSDVKEEGEAEGFFDRLYASYNIRRVYATRAINADPSGRGRLAELLITNIAGGARGV